MIPRYEKTEISEIWSDGSKTSLWQKVELAVIEARTNLGEIARKVWREIKDILESNPIDIAEWKRIEKDTGHDLDAFLDERRRFLPIHLRPLLHKDMTSFDTEEPAFATMLSKSIRVLKNELVELESILSNMAEKYRYTIMMGRTHGQEAELQTFGKRCLTWLVNLREDKKSLEKATESLDYSKLSGAIGNYSGISPKLEEEALSILGFEPFYGATQIMPRELYVPIAQAICQIVMTLDKIANDIRLGARSGQPIYQEPFGKRQKGSSRMPHKKNTISTEQMEGMARMAKGYFLMIMENIKTWEERAIEQSSVERVAWPDLFHVASHSLRTMIRVLRDLAIYPDNMMREIINSRGCYASGVVRDFLSEKGVALGLLSEEAYRIVQLAAFNVFSPSEEDQWLRKKLPVSLEEANENLLKFQKIPPEETTLSIKKIIGRANLRSSAELEITSEQVIRWNEILRQIFHLQSNVEEFNRIFSVPYLLRNEAKLYQEILGVE